ncbi:MAG TPA: hypothetical protein VGO40_21310 [Longimicrobium sp.]|jgi:hypothetical protein|nr:hypothetical protein [Longimicrobium sp.]
MNGDWTGDSTDPVGLAKAALTRMQAQDAEMERARLEGRLTANALNDAATLSDEFRAVMAEEPTFLDRLTRGRHVRAREQMRSEAIQRVGSTMVDLIVGVQQAQNAYILGRLWRIVRARSEIEATELTVKITQVRLSAFEELRTSIAHQILALDGERRILEKVQDQTLRAMLEKKMLEHAGSIFGEYDRAIMRIADMMMQGNLGPA